jgi:type I restriction enzyme S subunit
MNTKLLKQKILDLAIRGKLTQQLKSDGTAADLLKEICDRTQEKTSLRAKRGNPSPQTIIPLDKNEAPFEIPANWEWVRLGDVASLCLGKMLDKSKNKGTYCRYLRNVNIRWGEFDFSDIAEMKFEDVADNRFLIKYGDLVMCEGGEPGRCAVWTDSDTIHFQKALHRIRFFNGFIPKFYQYLFFFYANKKILDNYFTGSTIKHLTGESLREIPIPLPPLAEQQRIVAKIEESFAEIDAIEKNKELLKTHIKQTRQKILDLAIHGKLVPQNKSDEPASVLLERITRDNPHYEKLTDVPFEIPDSWEWVKLGDVVEINPKNKLDDNLEVSFIPMNLIEAGYSNRHKQESRFWKDVKKGFTHFAENDVALAKISPCFENRKSAIMKNLKNGYGAGTTELFVFRSSNVMLPSYLLWIIKSDDFIQAGTGNFSGVVGQQRLSREIVENYHIALPPLAEQKRIVNKIEEIFASLNEISLHLV